MRRLDTEKSFYRKNEGLIGGWWTEIIQAIGKGDDLGIGEILSQLLERAGVDCPAESFRRYGSARKLYNFDVDNADDY